MRITQREAAAIRRLANEVIGQNAREPLFGSRTRDDLRDGDIDLLTELTMPTHGELSASLRAGASQAHRNRPA